MWAIHPQKDSRKLLFPDNLLLKASAALLPREQNIRGRRIKHEGLLNVATFKTLSADVKIICTSAHVSDKPGASQRARVEPIFTF